MNQFYKKNLSNSAKKIKEDDVFAWASMLTLFLLLSIFPIIILVTDLITRLSLNDPNITSYLIDMLPGPVFDTIKAISDDIKFNQSSSVIPTAIILALWSASRGGVLAIIHALNKAYEVKETRSYIRLRALALLYTLSFLVLIFITLLLVVFGNNIYNFIDANVDLPNFLDPLFSFLRFGVTLTFSMIFFLFLYNLPPTIKIGIKKSLTRSNIIQSRLNWCFKYLFPIR